VPDPNFTAALNHVRALLETPDRPDRAWPAVLAALAFAICALGFATAAVLAPPVELTPVAEMRGPA
jgi:hypothetical protein